MTAPADTDPINAGSPETPPRPPDPVRPIGPAGGRRRLAAVLRLVLAGGLVAALLGPLPLADWAARRSWLSDSATFQGAIEQLDQVHAMVSFSGAYGWLRRQTRALQGLRFSPDASN